jgi:hypothetical protein
VEQSSQHDQKQDDVIGESGDHVKFGALGVNHEAILLKSTPLSANLQVNKPGMFKSTEMGYSQAQPLEQKQCLDWILGRL